MRLASDVSSAPAKFGVDRITTGEMTENRATLVLNVALASNLSPLLRKLCPLIALLVVKESTSNLLYA